MTTHRPNRIAQDRTAAERSITNMHDVLSDRERRYVLHVLQNADGSVRIADLAADYPGTDGEAIDDSGRGAAAGDGRERENAADDCADGATAAEPCDLATRLRDEHVVPMAEFGIVAYDRASDAVHLPDDVVVSVPAESL